jgi:hypothetical protein
MPHVTALQMRRMFDALIDRLFPANFGARAVARARREAAIWLVGKRLIDVLLCRVQCECSLYFSRDDYDRAYLAALDEWLHARYPELAFQPVEAMGHGTLNALPAASGVAWENLPTRAPR